MEGFEPVKQGCFGVLTIATFEGSGFLGCNDFCLLMVGSQNVQHLRCARSWTGTANLTGRWKMKSYTAGRTKLTREMDRNHMKPKSF